MTSEGLDRVRELARRLETDENALGALYDQALLLLDEAGELDPGVRAFLDEVRFAWHALDEGELDGAGRRRVLERLHSAAAKFRE
ncbi:MAG: hypothetical protein KBD01_11385 [Acidobacteria bacterium]|nr:hypothetical protein [Acidobacteriota bacterium]